ncbi:Enolase-phosphatase E1, variant 3 [Entomophthora muscae]|uniref:Enolase-phosphatase E1, variant 3 n=1 Tax=Entomophthora muscae TaxID=34485 RepID=A0ACC2SGH5_9FUNG|nr:Enolase-phosphatase E1, variant 3 [Entomophthora muscae]
MRLNVYLTRLQKIGAHLNFWGISRNFRSNRLKMRETGLQMRSKSQTFDQMQNLSRRQSWKNVAWQMHQDRKIGSLKNLQGYLWKRGYFSGELKSFCYPDVQEAFKRWNLKSIPTYIYSSGSINAQKLLFQYTEEGDLTKYITSYFDTITAGPKNLSQSYSKIASELGYADKPSEILFLTDSFIGKYLTSAEFLHI